MTANEPKPERLSIYECAKQINEVLVDCLRVAENIVGVPAEKNPEEVCEGLTLTLIDDELDTTHYWAQTLLSQLRRIADRLNG